MDIGTFDVRMRLDILQRGSFENRIAPPRDLGMSNRGMILISSIRSKCREKRTSPGFEWSITFIGILEGIQRLGFELWPKGIHVCN
jgi:hypothetical protein